MELTPQAIDAARTAAEIDRQVRASMLTPRAAATLEKRALVQHPPGSRVTYPVPPAIRNVGVQLAKLKRPAKVKKHVLP